MSVLEQGTACKSIQTLWDLSVRKNFEIMHMLHMPLCKIPPVNFQVIGDTLYDLLSIPGAAVSCRDVIPVGLKHLKLSCRNLLLDDSCTPWLERSVHLEFREEVPKMLNEYEKTGLTGISPWQGCTLKEGNYGYFNDLPTIIAEWNFAQYDD